MYSHPTWMPAGQSVPTSTSFDHACEAAGIKDFRFHDLRHTFARDFYQRTKDWKSLSMILGHADVSMTMKVYVNFDDNDLTEAMRKFDTRRS